MNEQLFRKKSIDKISSPEQLNEYIRVSNPSVWMLLAAIVVLLCGAIAWGIWGHIDTTVETVAVAENGRITAYVKEEDISYIEEGMCVHIDEQEGYVTEISKEPVAVNESFGEYELHVGNLKNGEWVYAVALSGELSDGVYSAEIVVESISPMSFVVE